MPDPRSSSKWALRLLAVPAGLALLAALFAAPSTLTAGAQGAPARQAAATSGSSSGGNAQNREGYWLVASDGGVFTFGNAPFFGSAAGQKLDKPITDIVPTPDNKGYWLVASDGGVFSYGDAPFFGSPSNLHLKAPIVGIASTTQPEASGQGIGPAGPQGPAGPRGPQGDPGPQGSVGPQGNSGKDATYVGPHWGIVHRNVVGAGEASLGSETQTPPNGDGALNIHTGSPSDKAAFGNEKDFAGMLVQDLKALSYSVFTTGENSSLAPNNMPSLAFEIDPNVSAVNTHYSTMVYAPDNTAPNQWTGIDAVNDTGKHWGLTGSKFAGTKCDINGPRCTFQEMQDYLNDGGDPARILTVQITKGRDYAFSGAVDGLVINDTLYDFEPFGVYAIKR
jgi:hypothetical protein